MLLAGCSRAWCRYAVLVVLVLPRPGLPRLKLQQCGLTSPRFLIPWTGFLPRLLNLVRASSNSRLLLSWLRLSCCHCNCSLNYSQRELPKHELRGAFFGLHRREGDPLGIGPQLPVRGVQNWLESPHLHHRRKRHKASGVPFRCLAGKTSSTLHLVRKPLLGKAIAMEL